MPAMRKAFKARDRNSSVAWCDWRTAGSSCASLPAVQRLVMRLEAALGIDRAHFEPALQLVNYRPGEFYREHMDQKLSLPPAFASGRAPRSRAALNPRILTAFVYLSDVPHDGGGETAFTRVRARTAPKLGRLLVWPNVRTDEPTLADERMHHEARTLRRGEKWGLNVWIRLSRDGRAVYT